MSLMAYSPGEDCQGQWTCRGITDEDGNWQCMGYHCANCDEPSGQYGHLATEGWTCEPNECACGSAKSGDCSVCPY